MAAPDNSEMRGDGEVDLMEELLDVAENFDELTDVADDKSNKRRKRNVEAKENGKIKTEGGESDVLKKAHSKENIDAIQAKPHKDVRKKLKPSKDESENENLVKKEPLDCVLEGQSDISSENEDEPSMSEASRNSSISRESSVEKTPQDETETERKRNPSEGSLKSLEEATLAPKPIETDAPITKKKYDYVTKINYMFRETRFFLMKSGNSDNIIISKSRNVWSTPPLNEAKLNQAFKEARNVILIFSVKESGRFCGFARLAGESRRDLPPVNWFLPPGLTARSFGGIFEIDWVSRKEISFTKTAHLYNPWNDGKPVKIGRDGQEIEPRVAEELCRLFPKDDSVNLTPILHKSKKSARERRVRGPLRRPLIMPGDRRGRPRDRGNFRGGRMDFSIEPLLSFPHGFSPFLLEQPG